MNSVFHLARGHEPDDVQDQARAWVIRLEEEPAAKSECDAWRALDPAHDQAFEEVSRLWAMAPALGSVMGEGWREEALALDRSPAVRARDWAVHGAGRIVLPLAVAASLAIVAISPQLMQSAPIEVATKVAQTEVVALSDGSKVTLGARSDLKVAFTGAQRKVTLAAGQAFFEVAHDNARPFIVLAGKAEIRVTGTKFDVRRVGDDVQVSVLQGRVELRRKPIVALLRDAKPAVVLTAGETSVLDDGTTFTPEAPAKVRPGEWRTGRLYYSEAPVSEIVADLQRYSNVPIRIADANVAQMKVTTSFRSNDVDGFVETLEATMPVRIEKSKDGTITLQAK